MISKEKFVNILSILFLICLGLLFYINFINKTIYWDYINKFNIIKNWLLILTIVFGSLYFYSNKEKVENIEQKEDEKEKEEENKRAWEFDEKFWKIRKVPIFRNIVKWLYIEGWRYSLTFLSIFFIFFIIRFWMPFLYSGSYIDEYNHIFSWIDFFKNWEFSSFNNEWPYLRGAFLSIYIWMIFILFWKSILIAKLSISFLSLISFFLLFKISRRLYNKKYYSNLLLFLFTINPLIIFEHFYIRPYIVYEIAILHIIYLFLKILDNINIWKVFKVFIQLLIINLIGSLIYFYSEKDVHRYIILIISLLITTYLYIFKFDQLKIKSFLFTKIFNFSKLLKFLILISFIPIIFYLFNINDLIIAIIDNKSYHWSLQNISKYYVLFFSEYFPFTIASIIVFFYIINKKKYNDSYFIYILWIFLIVAHLLSNENTHLLRWIIYILPLYFLIALYCMCLLDYFISKRIKYLFSFLSIFFILITYPKDFIMEPYIPWEINYMKYEKVADFIKEKCSNKNIIWLIHSSYIFNFYGKIDYTSNIHINDEIRGQYYFKNWNYKTIYNDIPVLTSMKEITKKINKNSCFIITQESKHSWYYFDENQMNIFEKYYNKKQFGTQTPINVFYK